MLLAALPSNRASNSPFNSAGCGADAVRDSFDSSLLVLEPQDQVNAVVMSCRVAGVLGNELIIHGIPKTGVVVPLDLDWQLEPSRCNHDVRSSVVRMLLFRPGRHRVRHAETHVRQQRVATVILRSWILWPAILIKIPVLAPVTCAARPDASRDAVKDVKAQTSLHRFI